MVCREIDERLAELVARGRLVATGSSPLDVVPEPYSSGRPIQLLHGTLLRFPPPEDLGQRRKRRGLAEADEPLIAEMRELITSGKATGPFHAADMVARKATGGGTFESKRTRLLRRYQDVYCH